MVFVHRRELIFLYFMHQNENKSFHAYLVGDLLFLSHFKGFPSHNKVVTLLLYFLNTNNLPIAL